MNNDKWCQLHRGQPMLRINECSTIEEFQTEIARVRQLMQADAMVVVLTKHGSNGEVVELTHSRSYQFGMETEDIVDAIDLLQQMEAQA